MSGDVTIPADVAREMAEFLRTTGAAAGRAQSAAEWADVLDPRPSLIDAARGAFEAAGEADGWWWDADDYPENIKRVLRPVLAVVRDHIAALEHPLGYIPRQDVLALFDGADQ